MAIDTIKFKRGVKSKLNNLSYGEPAYISDENELYIGTENGVEKITSNKEVKELSSQLEHTKNNLELINVLEIGLKGDGITDNSDILQNYVNEKTDIGLYFPEGVYMFNTKVLFLNKTSINIKGHNAILKSMKIQNTTRKCGILGFGLSCNIKIESVEFNGVTNSPTSIVYLDRGIEFGGCENVVIDNCIFKYFGDGAFGVSSGEEYLIGSKDVITKRVTVRNCYLNEFHQTSTTPNGVDYYNFTNNYIENMSGSIKFAQRKNSTHKIIIKNNVIKGKNASGNNGLEIVSNGNMEIDGNTFENLNTGINYYSNQTVGITPYDIDNIKINNNKFINIDNQCINFNNSNWHDGTATRIEELTITNNDFYSNKSNKNSPSIMILGNQINDIIINNNNFNDGVGNIVSIISTLLDDNSNIFLCNNIVKRGMTFADCSYQETPFSVNNIIIENNRIYNLSYRGFYITNVASILNVIFKNNYIECGDYGVCTNKKMITFYMSDNLIKSNRTNGNYIFADICDLRNNTLISSVGNGVSFHPGSNGTCYTIGNRINGNIISNNQNIVPLS